MTTPDGAPPGTTVDVLGYAGSVSAGFTTGGSPTVHADEPKGLNSTLQADNLVGPTQFFQPQFFQPQSFQPQSFLRRAGSMDSAGSVDAAERGAEAGADAAKRIYVTGTMVLDRENFAGMLGEFDGYARARATVLHELGHLVGLNHVDDPNQLMAPTLHGSLTEFAAGDREGLAALGRGPCVPTI